MRVLIEAVGSPAWGALFVPLREVATHVVGLDITPLAFGLYESDRGYIVPRYADPGCFERIDQICRDESVDFVIPSINEGLVQWAERRDELLARGIRVLISPAETIRTFADKWHTYEFFARNGIPTPRTSLRHVYDLIKPRVGRGGTGIYRDAATGGSLPDGCISQEFIDGEEISTDVLCSKDGKPVYLVSRRRVEVLSGVSMKGEVIDDPVVARHVRAIVASTPCWGPLNIQCFLTPNGPLFTEVNPRIAGGLTLSMAATENWFDAILRDLRGEKIGSKSVRNGLLMMRYFSDRFVEPGELL
jgi:carbamoyl-phosphate synthase large subunit